MKAIKNFKKQNLIIVLFFLIFIIGGYFLWTKTSFSLRLPFGFIIENSQGKKERFSLAAGGFPENFELEKVFSSHDNSKIGYPETVYIGIVRKISQKAIALELWNETVNAYVSPKSTAVVKDEATQKIKTINLSENLGLVKKDAIITLVVDPQTKEIRYVSLVR